MPWLARFVFVALLALPSFLFSGSARADQPVVQIILNGAQGYLGQGQSYYFDSFDGSMSISGSDAGPSGIPRFVSINFFGSGNSGSFASLDFATNKLGVDLVPGTYSTVQRASFASPGYAGLDVGFDGRGCNTVSGSFTVLDAVYVGTQVQRFDATFTENCDSTSPSLTGRVRINEPSALLAAVLPGSRSVQTGKYSTVFATILNTSSTALANCRVRLTDANISLSYQTTNPATNTLIGQPNTPVIIAANGSQSFLISFTSPVATSATRLPIDFVCDGTTPAPVFPGVDTVDLSYSATPAPDVIVLTATPSGDGIVTVPFSRSLPSFFAVATANVGAEGNLIVTPSASFGAVAAGSVYPPLTMTVCETNPKTGQCLATPSNTVVRDFASGDTPTFSIFVTATSVVGFDPANTRIYLDMRDSAGASRGSASVAVQTDNTSPGSQSE